MSHNTKKFIDTCCKLNPVIKSLCENECLFRNIRLKRYTCKIIPKDQYCVRPLCQDFLNKKICQCNNIITDNKPLVN